MIKVSNGEESGRCGLKLYQPPSSSMPPYTLFNFWDSVPHLLSGINHDVYLLGLNDIQFVM